MNQEQIELAARDVSRTTGITVEKAIEEIQEQLEDGSYMDAVLKLAKAMHYKENTVESLRAVNIINNCAECGWTIDVQVGHTHLHHVMRTYGLYERFGYEFQHTIYVPDSAVADTVFRFQEYVAEAIRTPDPHEYLCDKLRVTGAPVAEHTDFVLLYPDSTVNVIHYVNKEV